MAAATGWYYKCDLAPNGAEPHAYSSRGVGFFPYFQYCVSTLETVISVFAFFLPVAFKPAWCLYKECGVTTGHD